MRNLLAAGALILAAVACGDEEGGPRGLADLATGQIVRPPTPAYGGACPFPETQRLVTDDTDWRQIWSRLFACVAPAPALPPIDFEREALVLAALGSRSSGGYSVAVQGAAVDRDGVLQVEVIEQRPGPGCAAPTVVTYPVAVARVPRLDGPVTFRTRVVVLGCR